MTFTYTHHGFSKPRTILQNGGVKDVKGAADTVSIKLHAGANDELDWSNEVALAQELSKEGLDLFWEFDLGLERGLLSLRDVFSFQARMLALDHFVQKIYPEFKENTVGASLYAGCLDFDQRLDWEEEEKNFESFIQELNTGLKAQEFRALFATQLFAEYVHRLASILPDECPAFCLFDVRAHTRLGLLCQLLSKGRFEHIHLGVKGSSLPFNALTWQEGRATWGWIGAGQAEKRKSEQPTLGVVLPTDPFCTSEALDLLDQKLAALLESGTPFRIVPELLLTEEWDGLDTLVVVTDALSPPGKRKLQGFLAAGGVFSDLTL